MLSSGRCTEGLQGFVRRRSDAAVLKVVRLVLIATCPMARPSVIYTHCHDATCQSDSPRQAPTITQSSHEATSGPGGTYNFAEIDTFIQSLPAQDQDSFTEAFQLHTSGRSPITEELIRAEQEAARCLVAIQDLGHGSIEIKARQSRIHQLMEARYDTLAAKEDVSARIRDLESWAPTVWWYDQLLGAKDRSTLGR